MGRGLIKQPYNTKVPYDYTVKFSDKIDQTWVDVMFPDAMY